MSGPASSSPPVFAGAGSGYDGARNRQLARQKGSLTVIPYRKTTKNRPKRFARALYRGRARIEQAIGKLKRFKRIALRCEKTAINFSSFIVLAAAFILIKSVHRTLMRRRSALGGRRFADGVCNPDDRGEAPLHVVVGGGP